MRFDILLLRMITLIQKGIQPIVDIVGQFGLVQGTCPFVLNIYENVNCFMQNFNVKLIYLNNKHNFQIITLRNKKAPREIKTNGTKFQKNNISN